MKKISYTSSHYTSSTILGKFRHTFSERAAHYDRSGDIAFENLQNLRDEGFLSLAITAAHGGPGISFSEQMYIIHQLAQGDPSTALIVAMQYLHTSAISTTNTWNHKARADILNDILSHGTLVNALRVEPDLGTPSRGGIPHTRLSRTENGWRLNGSKIFSTGSYALTWGLVWCATDETPHKIGQVLVPLHQEGVHIEKSWQHLGMRATGSHTIHFHNVAVAKHHLINLVSPDQKTPESSNLFIKHALLLASLYDGIAHSAREWFISFLQNRTPSALGAPLSTLPRFHHIMGEIDALLLSNKALLQYGKHTETCDQILSGHIKYRVTENAISAINHMIKSIGNPALTQTNPLERHLRNILCGRIHSPQSDTVLENSGRATLMPPHPL